MPTEERLLRRAAQPLRLAPMLASAAWLAYGAVRRWRWPRLLPATVSLAALIACSLLVQTGRPHRQPTGAGEQGRILGDWHWEYH